MSEPLSAKYIITQPMKEEHGYEVKDGPEVISSMAYLDGGVIPGAFYVETHWFHRPTKYSPKEHTHDFDETLAFFGADPDDPMNLHGEVELFIDGERLLLTESCLVYIPAGTKHCPMNVRPADRPMFHFSVGNATKAYEREQPPGGTTPTSNDRE
jgi:mannose-6-phosphate isomerase-like protein (cupin superfamily)